MSATKILVIAAWVAVGLTYWPGIPLMGAAVFLLGLAIFIQNK